MERIKSRVWGRDGHRQRDSFYPSHTVEFDNITVHFARESETGTNAYTEVTVIAETKEEARRAFFAQLYDGAFECCSVGRIEVIV